MNRLTRQERDGGERLVLRAALEDGEAALAALAELVSESVASRPEGYRLLSLGLRTRPERGKRVEYSCEWVSEEFWQSRRRRAGRSVSQEEYEARKKKEP